MFCSGWTFRRIVLSVVRDVQRPSVGKECKPMTDPWDECIFTYMVNVGTVNIPVPCILKGRIPKSSVWISNFVIVRSVHWWYFGVALISHLTGGFRKQKLWHDFFGNLSSDALRHRHSRHIFVQSDFWKLHNNLKNMKALNGRLSGKCLESILPFGCLPRGWLPLT